MAKISDFINILRPYDDNLTTFDELLRKPEVIASSTIVSVVSDRS